MGIDYHLDLYKKIGDKFVRVYEQKNPEFESYYEKDSIVDPDIPRVSFGRFSCYNPLFYEFQEKVNSLAHEKLYIKFYQNPVNPIKPDKVLYTCEKLKEIFTKYENEFPTYYVRILNDPFDNQRYTNICLYKDGNIITIVLDSDDDHKCYLYNNDTGEKRELNVGDKVKGSTYNYKKHLRPDEIKKEDKIVISKEGNELVVYNEETYTIIKQNVYEFNKEQFDNFFIFCNFAKKKGYYVKGCKL
jgi:hypothetical protein